MLKIVIFIIKIKGNAIRGVGGGEEGYLSGKYKIRPSAPPP